MNAEKDGSKLFCAGDIFLAAPFVSGAGVLETVVDRVPVIIGG